MNIKSEINTLQKRLLARLNVKTGSTLYTIIQEVSRQAYAKQSFVVSQKNSTLAEKCNVTASTISRNLKKIKEKCADLLTIEQNRNTGEKFAALVFTFISQEGQTETSNGEQTEEINGDAEPIEVAENPSSSFSTKPLVQSFKSNKDLNTNIVNKEQVHNEQTIYEAYIEFKKQGIDRKLFDRVIADVKSKANIKNFKAYLYSALRNVIHHKSLKNGSKIFKNQQLSNFFEILQS
ncbi:hypothetical protein [Priestia megaterium]|uniref:hypothetical protein n=1 Tax=Priestia megaterium TaxID=1404 RepID=UPI002E22BC7A|nr:hypothetical protein [Priestia megaterium]MED4278288.1 hypothetical protein [Priestia megaterium]MED4314393.1 hypothetical protein [Priestia megaterium]